MKDHNHAFEELKKTSSLPNCTYCTKFFKPKSPYQLYCSESCENIKKNVLEAKRNSLFEKNCVRCGDRFRRTDERSLQQICDCCRRNKAREESNKRNKLKPKKEPKKKRLVSYDELIRRSEYKRLFDNRGWDHYLSGNRYNKI